MGNNSHLFFLEQVCYLVVLFTILWHIDVCHVSSFFSGDKLLYSEVPFDMDQVSPSPLQCERGCEIAAGTNISLPLCLTEGR